MGCTTLALEPQSRFGGLGAYVHLAGRSDYLSCSVAEIPTGENIRPENHLFDKLIYVVEGRGATSIEMPGGAKHTFEWGPGSHFAITLNFWNQHFNGSGTERVCFAAISSLALVLNLFHNIDFVFDNPYAFPRVSRRGSLEGRGR